MKYWCNGCETSCELTVGDDTIQEYEDKNGCWYIAAISCPIGYDSFRCMWVPVDPGVDTLTDAMEGRR